MAERKTIGVLSDTHNLLRPELHEVFSGVEFLLHAGDICSDETFRQLQEIAPVHAVRGNMDSGFWAQAVPGTRLLDVDGIGIYMLHDLSRLKLKPAAAGIRVVIHGHTHRPQVDQRGDVLYLNPGSAGSGRGVPSTAARLVLEEGRIQVEVVEFSDL